MKPLSHSDVHNIHGGFDALATLGGGAFFGTEMSLTAIAITVLTKNTMWTPKEVIQFTAVSAASGASIACINELALKPAVRYFWK